MKKIACLLENNNYMKKLKDFCAGEEFGIIDLSVEDFVYDYDIIVLIADNYAKISEFNIGDVPLAVIGKSDKAGFCYEINEDFEVPQLRALIDLVYHGGKIGYFSASIRPLTVHQIYEVKNDIFNVDKIVFNITKDIIHFCDTADAQKIRIGLSEIITNAVEHGNLEISGEDKFEATENGTYLDLVNSRIICEKFQDRVVNVDVNIDSSGFTATVKDMGKGFNVKKETAEKNEEDLLKLHGRGILITKMYFDEINYNNKGNEVRLYKKFL